MVMSTYNDSGYVRETVESVLVQTCADWELIITDDASTDETYSILKEFALRDSRIIILRNEVNSGAGIARNRSLETSSGRYVAFLDSDDWWYPTKLEKQLAFMKEKDCSFSYTDFEYCDAGLNPKTISRKPSFTSYSDLTIGNDVNIPGVMYDTEKTGKIFFRDMRRRQDWVMLMELAGITGGGYSVGEVLWKCRRHRGSLSYKKLPLIRDNVDVYHRYLGYSWMAAWCRMIFKFIPFQISKRMRLIKVL